MHLNELDLRSWIDGEGSPEQHASTAAHLSACASCSARLAEMQQTANRVKNRLNVLSPVERELVISPHTALRQFDHRKEHIMSKFFRRPVWVALSLALVLGVSLLFPPVQALAGSFLGLFRVQQVQVISFDPANLERLNSADANQVISDFFEKNMKVTSQGEFRSVGSKAAASNQAGFTPRLPADVTVASLGIQPGQVIEVTIDSASMNAGLEYFGYKDVQISADLDGQKIEAIIPKAVTAGYGQCATDTDAKDGQTSADCIILIQMPAPTVTAPDAFPVVQLGEVALQTLGMSQDEARQLSQSIDWSTTLILPIPIGQGTQASDVQVDGVKGNLVIQDSGQYALIWVKDGIVYAMTGHGDPQAALTLAGTLQ